MGQRGDDPSDPEKPNTPPKNMGKGGSMTPVGGYGGSMGGGGSPLPPLMGEDVAGPTPLRRLTLAEYNNTLRDLLGVGALQAGPDEGFSTDLEAFTRGFLKGATVGSANDARLYLTFSEKVAEAVMTMPPESVLPAACAKPAASGEATCAKQFIDQFGLRAFRRPLNAEEKADLNGLYTKFRSTDVNLTYVEAIRGLITAMLQTPMFGYRWEVGDAPIKDGDLVRLGPYEIASRVSYMTTASMPDQALFAAAASGELSTDAGVEKQVRRLLTTAGGKAGMAEFIVEWLNATSLPMLSKDESFTNYTPAVGVAMLKETGMFFASIMNGTGKLEDVYTSSNSFVDGPLAKLYGMTGVTGAQMQAVTLNPNQRAGVLTQGAYLASQSEGDHPHPVHRGLEVLEKVLCMPITPPKDFIPPPVKDVMPGISNRRRYEESTMGASCAACHSQINGIGFAFENYDAVGGWRDTDANQPVNASGSLSLDSGDVSFKNAVEFTKAIAKTPEARGCFVKQFLEYAVRRPALDDHEKVSLKTMSDAFATSGYDLRELLVATTKTKAFTHRQPLPGEGQQ
jgi:hypothetical protein